ncbi:MAG: DCC1-like thiol-disulfide oxidoreductase family protein [Planctomycetota bacterium]|nr:DCC1-like thiol-disulfide oxidoreductase family protein [Planctomycetota bacterium]
MAPHAPHPVVLFDGVCTLCNRSVAWIVRRDRAGVFRFASLQSRAAAGLLGQGGMPAETAPRAQDGPPGTSGPPTRPDSMVLIDADGVHVRSDAVLRIARGVGGVWGVLARVAGLAPRVLRDRAYDAIARRRYRWFGRREACMVPAPEVRNRFLDADEAGETLPGPRPDTARPV